MTLPTLPTLACLDILALVVAAAKRVDRFFEEQAIRGSGRMPVVVAARTAYVVLCRQRSAASYPEIAAGMGKVNHSTAITIAERHARGRMRNKDAEMFARIMAEVTEMECGWARLHPSLDGSLPMQAKLLDSLGIPHGGSGPLVYPELAKETA